MVSIIQKYNIPGGNINHSADYQVFANGIIKIENDVIFDGFNELPTLPRVGLKMAVGREKTIQNLAKE